jgi:hypothetical protein
MTPDPPVRNRRQLLLAPGAAFNGIDYVSVAVSQTQLFVHFLNTVPVQGSLSGPQVTITGGDVITAIAVQPPGGDAWSADSEGS